MSAVDNTKLLLWNQIALMDAVSNLLRNSEGLGSVAFANDLTKRVRITKEILEAKP